MNNQGLIRLREYIAKDKPKVLRKDFKFSKPLTWGWLLPYVLGLDDITWERWEYWAQTKVAGKLLPEPIPQIEWASQHGESSPGRKMLERALNCVTQYGEWRGWSSATYFEWFLDWLLFGLADPSQRKHPDERQDCQGASERLYQIFNLEPLIAYPHDYFGEIMAENAYGRHCGFFPTPMEVAHLMAMMTIAPNGEDMRAKSVMDPAVGTGRLLLAASNYALRLSGQDINRTVLKCCLVNGYLYAPWMVRPFAFLDQEAQEQPTAALPEAKPDLLPEISVVPTTAETKGPQLELVLA